jgi:TetR/AcrR family transcriptional regulator, lmrAB and yxaGH operons repressor
MGSVCDHRRMPRDSRARMVASAASLIGAKGVAATSFSEVLKSSGAPRGSIYHHFPKGKQQLAGDAMRLTKAMVNAYQRECSATTPSGVLDHFVEFFRRSMVSSRCQSGCPVTGVLVDTFSTEDRLRQIGKESFRAWVSLLSSQFRATGVSAKEAQSLAVTTLASVEGALILCRAERGIAPLNRVNADLRVLATAKTHRRQPPTERTPPAR